MLPLAPALEVMVLVSRVVVTEALAEQPLVPVTVTVYKPVVLTIIFWVVAPVDQL